MDVYPWLYDPATIIIQFHILKKKSEKNSCIIKLSCALYKLLTSKNLMMSCDAHFSKKKYFGQ